MGTRSVFSNLVVFISESCFDLTNSSFFILLEYKSIERFPVV